MKNFNLLVFRVCYAIQERYSLNVYLLTYDI